MLQSVQECIQSALNVSFKCVCAGAIARTHHIYLTCILFLSLLGWPVSVCCVL